MYASITCILSSKASSSLASKDGGRPDQLVLYRDAPASDFLGGKTLEAECPFTWRSALWKGYFRWSAETVMMILVVARSRRSVSRSTRGRTCCGATAGEAAWVGTPGTGGGSCVLTDELHM